MPVTASRRDDVLVLTLDNPPVNSLGRDMRRALVDAVTAAQDDASLRAIVITGAGTLFSGGADIREFDIPQPLQQPGLPQVIDVVEASARPVIVAINGTAIGGGLELALGAHHRVAHAAAQVGLPEVKLGLLPGAGGTQRLPRAVGLARALEMIVSGAPVAARALADTRLFDVVTDGDALDAALALAATLPRGAPPRVRDWPVTPDGDAATALIGAARGAANARPPRLPAPAACIDALEVAAREPFDAGIAFERDAFMRLLATPESQGLRHAFFAERAAGKVAGLGADLVLRPIRAVGVVGAGTMGVGIAMAFLDAGLPVTLLDTTQAALDRGVAGIARNYAASASKGRLSADQVAARTGALTPSLEYGGLAGVDLVVEAVFEDYAVKQAVFERLDAVLRPGAILASNTSTLDLDRIARFTRRPGDVIGMHFFSPANVMRLLEVVRGAATTPEVLATVLALARTLRKTAVVSGVCDGFIGNRMIEQYGRQAGFLLDEGALPAQVDRAMEAFGFAMGPFRMGDLAGNDIGWAIRKRRYVEQPDMAYSETADLLCERGRFGQKTGKGWYDYQPGERTAQPSAEVDAMVEAHSRALGIARRAISDGEIVERLLFALANEGALILEDGIAAKASDIDVVYLAGYGFPAWRGGPMFHADQVGLDHVLAAMRRFAQGYQGNAWQPAPLLEELAARGGRFNAPPAAA